jgi:hypothetical protein
MMSRTLSVAEHRTLLRDALSAVLATDAFSLPVSMMYTPDTHRAALFADSIVVRGSAGQGKSFWARALMDPQLRAVAAREYRLPRLERTETVTAFGGEPDASQPSAGELRALAGWGVQPTALWSAVTLTALGVSDLTVLPTWTERVDWLVRNPAATDRCLAEFEAAARAADTTRLVVFDALDQLHPDRGLAEHLASGILNVALALSRRTTRLRAKVLIRPDMLDGALTGVPSPERAILTSLGTSPATSRTPRETSRRARSSPRWPPRWRPPAATTPATTARCTTAACATASDAAREPPNSTGRSRGSGWP